MPPAGSNQGRKRGHPAASAEEEVASRRRRLRNSDTNANIPRDNRAPAEQPGESEDRPRKRTRKHEKENDNLAGEEAPKARGRKSKRPDVPTAAEKEKREAAYEAGAEAEAAPKKRGQPRKGSVRVEESQQVQPRRSKRDRQSGASQEAEQPPKELRKKAAPANQQELALKKRARPSSSVQAEEEPRPRKRGRPSREQLAEEEEEASQQTSKRKRGRKPHIEENDEEQEGSVIVNGKKGRRRPEKTQEEPEPEQTAPKKHSTSRPRRSQQVEEEAPESADEPETGEEEQEEEEEEEEAEEPDHNGLVPQVNSVSQRTIKSKWSPLDGPSIAMVTSLLHDAARPVLLRLKDEKKRALAASALQAVSNRLRTKMARGLPFPPASTMLKKKPTGKRKGAGQATAGEGEGRENRLGELSFDSAVDGVRAAQQRLTPLLHSVALLTREKERQEQLLKRDYETLNGLEKNAREQKRTWRAQLKKTHPLVPDSKGGKGGGEGNGAGNPGMELLSVDRFAGRVFRDIDDPELLDLAHQANNHMDSITGNLKQIDGVLPAIDRTRAALQEVLHRQLDETTYEHVVLG